MSWVYDADSHIEEGDFTFGDKYWDKRFLGRRPIVVEGDSMGNLCWVVDSWTFPRNVGPASATAGPPNSLKGVPSKLFHERVVKAAERGMKITLEGIEFHSTKARLDMMDQQELAVQVNFPSILLTWPFAYDPKIGAAIARSYNDHMADIASGAPDRLKWMTAIDPSDVEESVREIHRTRDMGSIGLMLLGTYGDLHLDHPALDPIWRACAELEMPVAIHPGFCNPGLDNQYDQCGRCPSSALRLQPAAGLLRGGPLGPPGQVSEHARRLYGERSALGGFFDDAHGRVLREDSGAYGFGRPDRSPK